MQYHTLSGGSYVLTVTVLAACMRMCENAFLFVGFSPEW